MTLPPLSPRALTIAWLLLPYLSAFLAALLPSLGRALTLFCCLATAVMAGCVQTGLAPERLELLGPTGVLLQLDALTAPFLLLCALICAAVVLDGWHRPAPSLQPLLLLVLHGGLISAFLAADLISLYVTLEVVGISAFLLILIHRTDRSLWVALRYLLVGNSVMTLYLIGAAIVYGQQGSFRLEAVEAVAALGGGAAVALLLLGLLTKAGLFLSGLWLPRTHAEAPADVSALLSGVVVTAGVVPLLRLSLLVPPLLPIVRVIGIGSALLGVLYALGDQDAKRLLAWSTLSQMGLVVLSPPAGGLMALGHGLAKAALFLTARHFPSRQLNGWSRRAMPAPHWWPLWIGSLSIAGLPPLLGYAAKARLEEALPGFWAWAALLLSVGTVAVYARLWGAPLDAGGSEGEGWSSGNGLLLLVLLLAGVAGVGSALSWSLMLKTLLVLAAGVALHRLLEPLRQARRLQLPDLERLPDLLGTMGVVGAGLLVAMNR